MECGMPDWMHVQINIKIKGMKNTQIHLSKQTRKGHARSRGSVAPSVGARHASPLHGENRKGVRKPYAASPVAIWDGQPKCTSVEHDSICDRS